MNSPDRWRKLLSAERLGSHDAPVEGDEGNAFLSDYSRVVFSPAFRRLQDKTQVNPVANHDFVRRRLTHSMEVATVGERMGRVLASKLKDRLPDAELNRYRIGTIVATACLLHDIGNPPFGHAGEYAIREWGDDFLRKSSDDVPNGCDGCRNFDGNAQGFRIATRLQHNGKQFGMNLTAATLGAYVKYPRVTQGVIGTTEVVDRGSYSVFPPEEGHFGAVCESTGVINGRRHPLSFIVEAADDMVNRLCDIEDGLKLGALRLEQVREVLGVAGKEGEALLKILDERRSSISGGVDKEDGDQLAYQHFRVMAIARFAGACESVFVTKIDEIESGQFQGELIGQSTCGDVYGKLKDLEYAEIFNVPEILKIEAAGSRVIKALLDTFMDAVICERQNEEAGTKRRASGLARLVPRPLLVDGEEARMDFDVYRVVDYVSGMTDRFAVQMYQELTGVTI